MQNESPEARGVSQDDLLLFWKVYEQSREEVSEAVRRTALKIPAIAELAASLRVDEQGNRRSEIERQRRAVLEGRWSDYLAGLREQGTRFARAGVELGAWFEVKSAFRSTLFRKIFDAHGTQRELLIGAVRGMDYFLERAITALSEAYLEEERRLIREGEMRYRRIVETSHEAIWSTDTDGTITYANGRLAGMVGLSPEMLVGAHISSVLEEPGNETLHRSSRGAREEPMLVKLLRAGGGHIWALAGSAPIANEEGAHEGYLGIAMDITERKRAEEMLARSNAELERFAYVASHDLQEPLRKLVAFSELLPEDLGTAPLPDAAARDLEFIQDAARRMQQLLKDLLELSRVHEDRLSLQRVELDDCVDRALAALEVTIEETRARIRRASLPSVEGDPTLLSQLFQNLIANALKFAGEGPPEIEVTAERDGSTWVFGVRDHGIGIRQSYLEQIFLPFKRLHKQHQYPGSGIGLAICRKAVELHGGRLWVESSGEGGGAHFRFTLEPETVERA